MAEIARPFYETNQPITDTEEEEMKPYMLHDARNGAVWLCAGNTKYHLKTMKEVDVHKFFGVNYVANAPVAWLDSLCTIVDK
jgi:hypothetical protein